MNFLFNIILIAAFVNPLNLQKQLKVTTDPLIKRTKKDIHQSDISNPVYRQLKGTWAAIGEDNATFIIDNNTFFYPDHDAFYKYACKGSFITIHYDGFNAVFGVKFKGRDTLMLSSAKYGKSSFYRFKK